MMHQGMDLSRFKKVASDKKTTTLRHVKGHEVKIAHGGLSPKMKEDLEKMPVYAADGVDTEDPQAMDPSSPEETNEQEADDSDSDDDSDSSDPETSQTPTPPAPDDPAPAASAPQAPQINTMSAQDLKQQDQWTQADLAVGHIKPETYADLFAKKSTLGKLGSIFGMMLSGAGSGLAHQPNLLIDRMNREITNDLEAQKANAANKLNFVSLNQKQQMQTAEIKKMQQEGVLNEAQAKHLIADANIKSYTLSRMQTNRASLHHLVMQVQKYPVGSPQRAQAEQALAILQKGVDNENFDLADRAEAASALSAAAFGATPIAGTNPEAAFQQGQTTLRMSGNAPIADDKAARHMPGIDGMASVPLTADDRKSIVAGTSFQQQLDRFTDWTKRHSGDLNPKDRAEGQALAAQLQSTFRDESLHTVYREGEQPFISKVIDSDPTKFFNSVRVLPKLQAVKKESAAQLDNFLKSKGFSGYGGANVAEKSSGSQTKTVGGVTYKRGPNGEAVPVSGVKEAKSK